MKKSIAIILAVILTASVLCACEPVIEPGISSSLPASQISSVPADNPTDPPATQPPVGTLSDYVAVAKEATVSYGDGNTNTLRLPKFLMNTADAGAANAEIMSRFGEDCEGGSEYSPVSMMDYDAFLNDNILSLYVTAKYDGGNSYGLCYCFDVTTGSLLDNQTLCSMTGRDYNTAIATLTSNVTTEYDSKYSNLPGNDTERTKTLSSENIAASTMYLDVTGDLTAMVQIYAAVGGGQWVNFIAAE